MVTKDTQRFYKSNSAFRLRPWALTSHSSSLRNQGRPRTCLGNTTNVTTQCSNTCKVLNAQTNHLRLSPTEIISFTIPASKPRKCRYLWDKNPFSPTTKTDRTAAGGLTTRPYPTTTTQMLLKTSIGRSTQCNLTTSTRGVGSTTRRTTCDLNLNMTSERHRSRRSKTKTNTAHNCTKPNLAPELPTASAICRIPTN